MKSIIITNRDTNGEPGVGHVVVKTGQRHAAIQEATINEGLDALATLSTNSPRRAEIADWINRACADWPLPPGEYPLIGRAAIVIHPYNLATIAEVRAASDFAEARGSTGRSATRTMNATTATAEAAIAAARKALCV